ncbi:hypothetical protein TNCV_1589171 [Trichonephila clavipes]|uniref:Uncharacterized protein n=1 Tax=Trichonephila clavipes TaxID=2585209 RepID=A0A8X6RFK8_TRICX|nr:hypothetical protein TNCV_1589171 [Trichonephila clavipes]
MVQKGFVNSAYRGKRRVLERNYSKTIEKFYFKCVLPEILDGRAPRNMPLREPLYIEESSRSKKQKMIDIGIISNEIADSLAKAATLDTPLPNTSILSDVFFDTKKRQRGSLWRVPPEHVWYPQKLTGGALPFEGQRTFETSHLTFEQG